MLRDPTSVVTLPLHRAAPKTRRTARASFWITFAAGTLLVPSADAADSQGKPPVDGTPHERERRQPHRPSYLTREEPGQDLESILGTGLPPSQRLEQWLGEQISDETRASLPAISDRALPKEFYVRQVAAVWLRLVSKKVTSRQEPGRQVIFKVEEDVRFEGSTCIARGTPVSGVVGPWTEPSRGLAGTGLLEIRFDDAATATGTRVKLQTIRIFGRTLGESMSWVSDVYVDNGAAVAVLGMAALGHVTGELFARAVFKTDEVKFRKGNVILVNVWAPWDFSCEVGHAPGSAAGRR